jgi:hypothetical protein
MKKIKKIKMALPPRGMAIGACRRGVGRQGPDTVSRGPAAVPHIDRDLMAWDMATEMLAADVYFSEFSVHPFIVRISKKKKIYKKF